MLLVCALFSQARKQYSASGKTSAGADVRGVSASTPHVVPHSLCMMLFLNLILATLFSLCFLKFFVP